jgi:hypothetical protein
MYIRIVWLSEFGIYELTAHHDDQIRCTSFTHQSTLRLLCFAWFNMGCRAEQKAKRTKSEMLRIYRAIFAFHPATRIPLGRWNLFLFDHSLSFWRTFVIKLCVWTLSLKSLCSRMFPHVPEANGLTRKESRWWTRIPDSNELTTLLLVINICRFLVIPSRFWEN